MSSPPPSLTASDHCAICGGSSPSATRCAFRWRSATRHRQPPPEQQPRLFVRSLPLRFGGVTSPTTVGLRPWSASPPAVRPWPTYPMRSDPRRTTQQSVNSGKSRIFYGLCCKNVIFCVWTYGMHNTLRQRTPVDLWEPVHLWESGVCRGQICEKVFFFLCSCRSFDITWLFWFRQRFSTVLLIFRYFWPLRLWPLLIVRECHWAGLRVVINNPRSLTWGLSYSENGIYYAKTIS